MITLKMRTPTSPQFQAISLQSGGTSTGISVVTPMASAGMPSKWPLSTLPLRLRPGRTAASHPEGTMTETSRSPKPFHCRAGDSTNASCHETGSELEAIPLRTVGRAWYRVTMLCRPGPRKM